ncbi:hypothetical protein ERJ75_001396500 [Trypanosoma vivax]|nr:hypothetical protein ERJ75_001396500 [Trypanosoma vivax]
MLSRSSRHCLWPSLCARLSHVSVAGRRLPVFQPFLSVHGRRDSGDAACVLLVCPLSRLVRPRAGCGDGLSLPVFVFVEGALPGRRLSSGCFPEAFALEPLIGTPCRVSALSASRPAPVSARRKKQPSVDHAGTRGRRRSQAHYKGGTRRADEATAQGWARWRAARQGSSTSCLAVPVASSREGESLFTNTFPLLCNLPKAAVGTAPARPKRVEPLARRGRRAHGCSHGAAARTPGRKARCQAVAAGHCTAARARARSCERPPRYGEGNRDGAGDMRGAAPPPPRATPWQTGAGASMKTARPPTHACVRT